MEITIIKNKDQLNELLNLKSRLNFKFSFQNLSDDDNSRWTETIRMNYFACGCKTGRNFMVITFLFLVIILFLKKIVFAQELHLLSYLYSLAILFIMAVVGKTIGKRVAYLKLRKDINRLKSIL